MASLVSPLSTKLSAANPWLSVLSISLNHPTVSKVSHITWSATYVHYMYPFRIHLLGWKRSIQVMFGTLMKEK